MKHAFKIALVVGCAAITLPATAQNRDSDPYVGEFTVKSGFVPDPQSFDVEAGGQLSAGNAASGCQGYISERPDLRLHFTAGSRPLIISVNSNSDTTLVINAADGQWYCDDDGGVNGSNPSVQFDNPASGRYEIWVGTYNSGKVEPAELYISELNSQ